MYASTYVMDSTALQNGNQGTNRGSTQATWCRKKGEKKPFILREEVGEGSLENCPGVEGLQKELYGGRQNVEGEGIPEGQTEGILH